MTTACSLTESNPWADAVKMTNTQQQNVNNTALSTAGRRGAKESLYLKNCHCSLPGVSKDPKWPKDYNHDPFFHLFSAKMEENSKNLQNQQKNNIFFYDFSIFPQVRPKFSSKTDYGCNP